MGKIITKGLQMLEVLAFAKDELTVEELVKRTGLTRKEIHNAIARNRYKLKIRKVYSSGGYKINPVSTLYIKLPDSQKRDIQQLLIKIGHIKTI